jgi:hypothetical protein
LFKYKDNFYRHVPGETLRGSVNNMIKEKRKLKRMKIKINISYLINKKIINKDYSINWIKCDLYDISENGIGLKINQTMLPGDYIKIKVETLKDEQIVDALINNVNGQRIGAKFINMNISQNYFLSRTISNSVFNNRIQRAIMY